MNIYPAIDIRNGNVVRLLYGNPDMESVYNDDPVAVAHEWKLRGASWVHVVNLDGALGANETALDILGDIASIEGIQVQFGGGVRSMESVEQALNAGASRVVLGTFLVQQPEHAAEAVKRFGADRLTVALDARDGQVTTHGWQEKSVWSPVDIGQYFAGEGLQYALYTDVNKDGALSGVNVAATSELATKTGLNVIASGGVASLLDVEQVKADGNIEGVVIGRALYAKTLKLEDALKIARGTL